MTKLNTDIKLPYHRHDYQVASIRIKFNDSKDSFDYMWPVCSSCLCLQEQLNDKKLEKIWGKYNFNIDIENDINNDIGAESKH